MPKDHMLLFPADADVPWPLGEDDYSCQLRFVLDRVGDKWSVLIMTILRDQPLYYSELRRRIDGISQRVLTLSLRKLERDGLVLRSVTPSSPPRVEYSLTEVGSSLHKQVVLMLEWAADHAAYITEHRARHDQLAAAEDKR
jgi:DNA-binding HxlR family transcriptional regulator